MYQSTFRMQAEVFSKILPSNPTIGHILFGRFDYHPCRVVRIEEPEEPQSISGIKSLLGWKCSHRTYE